MLIEFGTDPLLIVVNFEKGEGRILPRRSLGGRRHRNNEHTDPQGHCLSLAAEYSHRMD